VSVNEFTVTTASVHVTAWLVCDLAPCECWSGVKLQ